MLIFNPVGVADRLRAGTLVQAAQARLMLVGMVCAAVVGQRSFLTYGPPSDFVLAGVYLSILIGGVWGCFRANDEGDGRAFVARYTCLSTPLILWFYAAYCGFWLGPYAIMRHRPAFSASAYATTMQPYARVFSLVALVAYFAAMRRLIRRAASGEAPA
jgi:hypothetical protein